MINIFAWIVFGILVVIGVGLFVVLGMLPGYIARKRGHPWAEAVSVGGWVTLIFGIMLWPLVMIWAYVDFPDRKEAQS